MSKWIRVQGLENVKRFLVEKDRTGSFQIRTAMKGTFGEDITCFFTNTASFCLEFPASFHRIPEDFTDWPDISPLESIY